MSIQKTPVLLFDVAEDIPGADIELIRMPQDPALAAAMASAIPGGRMFLKRPSLPGDTSFCWIDQLAQHLNQHFPLPPGMTGVALAHDSGDEFSFDDHAINPRDLLVRLDDALILDLALRHLRPGCARDRGAKDWMIDGSAIQLTLDGASTPILIEVTDRRDVVAYEVRCPVAYGDDEEPDSDLGQLLADSTSSGWMVIPQFAVDQTSFEFTAAGEAHLRQLLQGDPQAAIDWVRSMIWSAFRGLDDPIVGYHELPLFGYAARNLPADDQHEYTVRRGTIEEYHAHIHALLAQTPYSGNGVKATIRSGSHDGKRRPKILEYGPLAREQRKVLKMIVNHFRPNGQEPIDFTFNRFGKLASKPIHATFGEPDMSAHQRIVAYLLVKDFLTRKGKSEEEADAMLQG